MNMYKYARPAVTLCLLTSLTISQEASAASTDEYANIHSVGVISAIGDDISLLKIGSTVFGNGKSTLRTSDWNLDQAVVQQVTEAISARFAVKPITADATPLETNDTRFLHDGTPDVKSFILGLPQSNDVDAYVVVRKTLVQDIYGGTNQYLWGLGIYRHSLIFGGSRDGIYAFYAVQVIDAKTGKIIDYGTPRMSDGSILTTSLPWDSSDPADWAETPDAMTDQQKQAIKAHLLSLVEISLPRALKSAGLIELPPIK
jgi:hypothetical protein